MITLTEMIVNALDKNSESWDNIVAKTVYLTRRNFELFDSTSSPFSPENKYGLLVDLTEDELLSLWFQNKHGYGQPIEVLVWTEDYVYFTHDYDGLTSIMSVPRNPVSFR
jgi:hypothetical protein